MRENTRRLEEQVAMMQQMMQQQRLNPNPNGSFQNGFLHNNQFRSNMGGEGFQNNTAHQSQEKFATEEQINTNQGDQIQLWNQGTHADQFADYNFEMYGQAALDPNVQGLLDEESS